MTDLPATVAPAVPRVSRRGLVLDAAIALALAALLVVNGTLVTQLDVGADVPTPTALTWASGVAMCLVLAWRRVAPLVVLVVVAVSFSVYGFSGGVDVFGSNVALFLATVTAGSHGHPRWRNLVRGVVIAGLFGTLAYAMVAAQGIDASLYALALGQAYSVTLNVLYFAAAWVLGDQVRARFEREATLSRRTAELAARTVELEHERRRTADQARTTERLRLARELHDVLGHHVSVMGVQAAAARRVLPRDPERAGQALADIERSSRQAVSELQRVLQLLRADGDQVGGGLSVEARLEVLARELRTAGLTITAQVTDLPALPTEIDLAVGRVVQEALTNALRHAGPGTSAWVRLRGTAAGVEVEVVDDAAGTPLPDDQRGGTGSGVAGMRERVELHGGRFTVERVRPRGWRVAATIPLPADGREGTSPDRSSPPPAVVGP